MSKKNQSRLKLTAIDAVLENVIGLRFDGSDQ